jgi:DNA-binding NtrC family response regulator
LNGIKEEMSTFNATIRRYTDQKTNQDAAAREREREKPSEAQVKKLARDLLQEKDNHLDDDSMIAMFDLFQQNVAQAETYIDIKRESLRRRWLKLELQKVGRVIPDFTPPSNAPQ